MSHLSTETLWSLARAELSADEVKSAELHLADCPECRVSFDDVKLAQSVLMDLPPVPAMPEAMARRVGHQLAEAADARAAKQFTSWWQSLFTPRFVLASAMAIAMVITGAWLLASPGASQPTPTPIAQPTPAVPPTPDVAPVKKLSVTVASAHKSSTAKKQVLTEGAKVATQSGGSVWMQLPDGSRAGLTGSSEVTLAKLESKELTLDVARGSLALVVPHREDRVLVVRAGDLEVKDLAWEPTPPPPVVQPAAVAPSTPEQSSVARLEEEDEDEAPLPPVEQPVVENADQTPVPADEQWAGLPEKKKLPPVSAFAPPPKSVTTASDRAFSLRNIERKLREIGSTITTPTGREARARNVALTADAGDCEHALRLAEAWLAEPITGLATEQQMLRSVRLQQVRCLNRLGRTQEADAIQRAVETAH